MWRRRSFVASVVGAMLAPIAERYAVSAPAEAQDPACGVFLAAWESAKAYSEVAAANLTQTSTPNQGFPQLSKFDTHRMAAALQRGEANETLHYVLYLAGADKKLTPISLRMLWSIHSNIVFVNAANSQVSSWDTLKEKCLSILVESQLLAEVFRYAADVCSEGLGGQVIEALRSDAPLSLSPYPKLLQLSTQHQVNVLRLSEKLRSEYPNSKIVADNLAAFSAVDLPVWTAVKEHPGARVINDVWFPKQYAEPLLKALVEEQAKSSGQHASDQH